MNEAQKKIADAQREPLLKIQDLCAYFQVSRRTVYNWIARGRLTPTMKTPGGHPRFSREEIRLLEERGYGA